MRKRSETKATITVTKETVGEAIEESFIDEEQKPIRKRSEVLAEKKAAIAETSDQLERAMQSEPMHSDEKKRSRPELSKDFEAIVERVFIVDDILPEYVRLEAHLKIGEKRSDYATVREALDSAEDNARNAHRLYLTACLERERYERQAEPVQGAMWDEAARALEREKDEGMRRKQITDADVRAKASSMFADEWSDVQIRRAKVKWMVDQCEALSRLWSSRCARLDTMATTMRR